MTRRLHLRGSRSARLARPFALGLAVTALATIATVGFVQATPGSGAVGTELGRGTLPAGTKIYNSSMSIAFRDDVQVVTQTIRIAPGGHTGWHSHPGPVFVTITQGTMSFYFANDPDCTEIPYATGDTFIDRGGTIHIARNEGATDLVLYATYLVPVGVPFRIDQPNPGNCSF
jgi:quercetin dioxygenase-like cupin family protein